LGNILKESFSVQEKIKSRLKSGKACYYSVHNLLSSSFLSKNIKIKIYRTIILRVVLYGCETWPVTLMEKRRLRVFENKVLWKVFGANRDEVTREWRKLHNEEPNDLYPPPPTKYYSGDKIERNEVGGLCSTNGGEVCTGFWWENLRGKDHFRRPRRRWENNKKMDLQEMGWGRGA
jgi:hypothetical protein